MTSTSLAKKKIKTKLPLSRNNSLSDTQPFKISSVAAKYFLLRSTYIAADVVCVPVSCISILYLYNTSSTSTFFKVQD